MPCSRLYLFISMKGNNRVDDVESHQEQENVLGSYDDRQYSLLQSIRLSCSWRLTHSKTVLIDSRICIYVMVAYSAREFSRSRLDRNQSDPSFNRTVRRECLLAWNLSS